MTPRDVAMKKCKEIRRRYQPALEDARLNKETARASAIEKTMDAEIQAVEAAYREMHHEELFPTMDTE